MNKMIEFRLTHETSTMLVARVRGVLDATTVPELLKFLAPHRSRGRHVVLNLTDVTFIASSGVGVLLALDEELRSERASLRLAQLSPGVDSVLQLLNLDQFLNIDATEAAAIASAGKQP